MSTVDRCWRCGREIREPLSVFVGMGPVCRAACGIVEARGYQALENMRWWREDRRALYFRLVDEIRQEVQWWRMRLTLIEPGAEALFDDALDCVDTLQDTNPNFGQVVMGHVWKLVAQLRFVLEPTLKTLRDAGIVQTLWVEGVPELSRVMPNVESLLCGIGAVEDSVEFAAIRSQDRAGLMSNTAIAHVAGIEESC